MRPHLVGVQAVRLIDEEDPADSLVHHPLRLDGGLADVATRPQPRGFTTARKKAQPTSRCVHRMRGWMYIPGGIVFFL